MPEETTTPAAGGSQESKKQTVRISLPPKPAASPTIKISVPPAGAAKAASTIKIPVPPKTAARVVGIPKTASATRRETPVAQKKEVAAVAAAEEEAVATPMRKKARVKKAAPYNTFDTAVAFITAGGAIGLAAYLWKLGQTNL